MILDTRIGFLGLVFKGSTVVHLSLGHKTEPELIEAICRTAPQGNEQIAVQHVRRSQASTRRLIDRVYRYTEGEVEEFFDVD